MHSAGPQSHSIGLSDPGLFRMKADRDVRSAIEGAVRIEPLSGLSTTRL
jgi:hypothetical protein